MQNRRKFLRNSLIGAAGAGLTSRVFAGPARDARDPEKNFLFRTLGKTGIKVPVISLGTGNTDNPNLVREAYNRGIRLFATSEYYQNGNNEKMLGEALKPYPRDTLFLYSGAIGGVQVDFQKGLYKPETNPEVYLEHANGCLKRLQVDYLDVFSLGFAAKREGVFYEPLLKAIEKFKQQGKTRFAGIATHNFEPEAIRAAADTGIYDVIMTAYNFRKTNTGEINEAIDYATAKGLGIIAMKTMAGAFWDRERTKPINTRAALKWVLQNEKIGTTVPDCSSFDQLYQNLELMADLRLTEDEKRDLEAPPANLSTGIYCQQCGECLVQCPENLDIPSIMRSYMYAYGYNNLVLAKQALVASSPEHLPCRNCENCTVDCRMGFNVREKICDIGRLKDIPGDLIGVA